MSLPVITSYTDLKDKTILLRIDSDVDIHGGHIIDDTRLQSSLETIHFLLEHDAKIILLGHLGRPDGRKQTELSLHPVAEWFSKKLHGGIREEFFGEFPGWRITPNISLLENLRFYKGEEECDPVFTQMLADLSEVYVDDAFAVSHRNHASIVGIAKHLPSYAGVHFAEEVETLSKIIKDPNRPLVVLIGGAKIETKLPMVERMHHVADYVLVGGEIAEQDRVLIKVQHEKIPGRKSIVLVADNTPNGLDITDKSAENFIQIFSLAKTIVWNGPVGLMGKRETEENTLKIARAIIASHAFTVVGGGDSLAFLKSHHLLEKFSFVSTGGGAMLELLAGKKLPGIEALMK